jgi:hypothetical protein
MIEETEICRGNIKVNNYYIVIYCASACCAVGYKDNFKNTSVNFKSKNCDAYSVMQTLLLLIVKDSSVKNTRYESPLCGISTLGMQSNTVQILCFWTLCIVLFLSKTPSCLCLRTQRFGDWILSPSSGNTYSAGSNR